MKYHALERAAGNYRFLLAEISGPASVASPAAAAR
jgi:hypothetical protein